MTKRDKTRDEDFDSRDRKRNRDGWKAQLKQARKAKGKRKTFERGEGKGWN